MQVGTTRASRVREEKREFFWHSGLACFIRYDGEYRQWIAGYVIIPKTHPLYGVDRESDTLQRFVVHRGITFAGEATVRSNIIEVFKPKSVWVVGWDCMHGGDFIRIPGIQEYPASDQRVWQRADVVAETERLAAQLATYK